MTIQILHYEFLGPIKLSDWGPPMDELVYVILARTKDTFKIIYVGHSEKTEEADFFTKNDKFKCWLTHAGSEKKEREKIVNKTIARYNPICNLKDPT